VLNVALYKQMLKTHGKSIAGYSIGSSLYLLLVIGLYPSIGGSKEMENLLKQMPEQFIRAFDLNTSMGNITEFIAGKYYSLLFILILSIYCIMTANHLMARLIDRGSIAYLLVTPHSRIKIALTQAFVLLTGIIMIGLSTTVTGIIGAGWFASDFPLELDTFFAINAIGMLLFFVVSGYSFLFSVVVSDEKKALALAAGVTFLFYCMDLIGKMSEKVEWLRNISLFSTYPPAEIAQKNVELLPLTILLAILGIMFYAAGILIFAKRDLGV